MLLETKAQIARATLSLLTVLVSLFLLGVLVIVLCAGLNINPFKETTTSFLVSAFVGLTGVAAVLLLLNVASNISLIADAKLAELKVETGKRFLAKWALAFVAGAALVTSLIFAGTYISKERFLAVVHGQAQEMIASNGSQLQEISRLLASGQRDDFRRIADIREFLEDQRGGMPDLTIVYAGKFEDKLAFYKVNPYLPYEKDEKAYTPTYYSCDRSIDCDYLTRFFSGQNVGELKKYTVRSDDFYVYVPYIGREARYVLLFNRRNSYGKMGS